MKSLILLIRKEFWLTFILMITIHSSISIATPILNDVESDPHLVLPAIKFPVLLVEGFVPYYIDARNACLAVNSIKYPNQFAAAQDYFKGSSGTYNVTITTFCEIDGEPTYKLRINGKYIGSPYTQPYTGIDYSPLTYTWIDVKINYGDTIQVESNNHSNGKVPEGDAFAFARGRWTQLVLTLNLTPDCAHAY